MSYRTRCCCAPPCVSCQSCPAGCGTGDSNRPCRWRVYVSADDILPDRAGTGVITTGTDIVYSCMGGSCQRTAYRRKALNIQAVGGPDCHDETFYCANIMDDAAPVASGSHEAVWSFCASPINPASSDPYATLPDITDNQQGDVWIEQIETCQASAHSICDGIPSDECAWTIVRVRFDYSDTFDGPLYYEGAGDCDEHADTITVSRSWLCYYGRKVAAGQYFAEGALHLIRCDYPPGINTVQGVGQSPCTLAGGEACATNANTSPSVPTLWNPPAYITLQRLA